jgi:hypothetical protein
MTFIRKASLTALYSFLSITLFSFGLFFSLKMVLGTPKPLEQALDKSGIYDVIVQNVINQNKQTTSSGGLQLQTPEVQAAVQKAFPPTLIKQSTNEVLDGTYTWLQGTSNTPNFHVDLTQPKANLAAYVGQYVEGRLSTLPQCTLANLPTNLSNVDPYTATCVPPNFDKAAAVTQVKQEILQNGDILQNSVLTADTFKNDDGHTVTEQLSAIPRIYKALLWSIYATGGVALLAAIGIIFLHPSRRAGLRRVGTIGLTVGITSGLAAWLGSYVLSKAVDKLAHSSQTDQLIQTKLVTVLHMLADDLRTWWLGYGIVLVVGGVVIWVVLKYVMKQGTPAQTPELPASKPPLTPLNN